MLSSAWTKSSWMKVRLAVFLPANRRPFLALRKTAFRIRPHMPEGAASPSRCMVEKASEVRLRSMAFPRLPARPPRLRSAGSLTKTEATAPSGMEREMVGPSVGYSWRPLMILARAVLDEERSRPPSAARCSSNPRTSTAMPAEPAAAVPMDP